MLTSWSRSRGHRSKQDVKPTIGSSNTESKHIEDFSGGNIPSNRTTDLLENSIFQVKIEKRDEYVPESPPRMTIDGTCAPPLNFDTSFFHMARSPLSSPTSSPPKFFHARMSTGGRAPPKILSPQKEIVASVTQEAVLCISPDLTGNITPERTPDNESSSKASVRNDSVVTEVVTVKKPRGRPKKIVESQVTACKVSRIQSVGTSQSAANRPRGRTKKSSPSRSESPEKKPRERPRNNLASTSQEQIKRPRGRPKGSFKKRNNRPLPQVRAGQPDVMSAVLTVSRAFLSRSAKKKAVFSTEVSRSAGQTAGKFTSAKQRRPVGRPRKYVSDGSSVENKLK